MVSDYVELSAVTGDPVSKSLEPERLHQRRLNVPFAVILAVGVAGAVLAGAWDRSGDQPTEAGAAVTASVNGQPVQLGGPSVTLLERHLSPAAPARNPRRTTLPSPSP
jgi:hypothetical protein